MDDHNNSKFLCLTCGRSLESATSICPCGGRATRRSRPEHEVLEEENQKLRINWKYRKLAPKLLIFVFSLMFLGTLLISFHIILSVAVIIIATLILIGYVLAGLYYNCCPSCGRYLYRIQLNETFCSYCGKRIKPIEKQKE